MRLTKTNLAGLKLPEGKSEMIVFDEALPGFGVRLRSGGKRTWIAQFRIGTKQRRIALGTAETVEPDVARKRAKEALAKVSLGRDPQSEKDKEKRESSLTLGLVIPRYLAYAKDRQRPRHHADTKRYLERAWAPLHRTGLSSIDRSLVSARLLEIAADSGPYAANRARAALSAFHTWAIGAGIAHANPVIGSNKPATETSRDRVLTDAELILIWNFAGQGDFGAILRLLILTGARCTEIGSALWSEMGGDVLRIAGDRSKNGRPHDIPLSPQAIDVVRTLTRLGGRELIFGTGAGPFAGWSKAKAALDKRITGHLQSKHSGNKPLPHWRLHDIRRTVATRLGDLGVLPHVVEAILNHISGHKAGVAGIYNKATYAVEKRAALTLWGAHVADVGSE